MGKPTSKKKKSLGNKSNDDHSKSSRSADHNRKVFDEDASIFINMAHDFKEEGDKLFQKRNYDGDLVKYEKAIHECNLALNLSPNYTKALLKRARCFEAMNRLDSASRDVDAVLRLEPNNLTAIEVYVKMKEAFEVQGIQLADKEVVSPLKIILVREKSRGKKINKG